MSEVLRVLGQSAPAANTDINLYTVPASRATAISYLSVANRGTVSANIRVLVRPAGAAAATLHWVVPDVPLAGNSFLECLRGVTLAVGDIVTVRASTADVSFSLFGSEVNA